MRWTFIIQGKTVLTNGVTNYIAQLFALVSFVSYKWCRGLVVCLYTTMVIELLYSVKSASLDDSTSIFVHYKGNSVVKEHGLVYRW